MAGGMAFDTSKWLALHGLGVYAQAFRDNHIEAETLSSLTMDDLSEIGVISVGHRRKILAAIASLTGAELQPANLRAELLDGERRQVTILFANIAEFSTLSTEMDAERIHALLTVFFEHVDRIILSPANHAVAVALAALPLEIRGFGHIKEANRVRAKAKEASLLSEFRAPLAGPAIAAE